MKMRAATFINIFLMHTLLIMYIYISDAKITRFIRLFLNIASMAIASQFNTFITDSLK